MIQARVRVTGQVQGVNFRSSTKAEAELLGLTGWVANRPDGSVELLVEGPQMQVQQLVDWCRRGPLRARVDALQIEWQPAQNASLNFTIEA